MVIIQYTNKLYYTSIKAMTKTVHNLGKSQRAGGGENRYEYEIVEDHF